jgi:hypothetical protein
VQPNLVQFNKRSQFFIRSHETLSVAPRIGAFVVMLFGLWIIVPKFQAETLAALLGTVAGYILSKSSDWDD